MLLLNYQTKIWTKITQDKKSRAGWTEKKKKKGIANADNFFVRTIFFCLDKRAFTTK